MCYYFSNPNRILKLALFCALFSLYPLKASSQTQENSAQISQLLTERDLLKSQSESTREIDLELFNLGYRPKAHVTVIGNGFTFPLFLPISLNKQAVMESRLKSICPNLLTLQINEQDQSIIAQMTQVPTPAMIEEIIIHFGFSGYENY